MIIKEKLKNNAYLYLNKKKYSNLKLIAIKLYIYFNIDL